MYMHNILCFRCKTITYTRIMPKCYRREIRHERLFFLRVGLLSFIARAFYF